MNDMHAKMIICRCEHVTSSEILSAINEGAVSSQELKMKTRAGMGMCQGKVCRSLLASFVDEEKEGLCEHPSNLTYHFPSRPIHLDQVIGMNAR